MRLTVLFLVLLAVTAVAHNAPKKEAKESHHHSVLAKLKAKAAKCHLGSKGFNCRRSIRCKVRHHACKTHCLKTKGQDTCTDVCYKFMKVRACNACHTKKCRHTRGKCFRAVKMCQAKCSTQKCRGACRCDPKKLTKKTHPNKKSHKKHACPAGSKGYNCRRRFRCKARHHACMKHCKVAMAKKSSKCGDVCFIHLKHRACNACHDVACRTARGKCFKDLKLCQAKCATPKCRQACRCSGVKRKATGKPTLKPSKKPVVKAAVVKPVIKVTTPPTTHKVVAPTTHKVAAPTCAAGIKGYQCRRNERCKTRSHACHSKCKTRACNDECFAEMKQRACNRCHDEKCRGERQHCFTDLKVCQAKCNSQDCREKCRCEPGKKSPAATAAAAVKAAPKIAPVKIVKAEKACGCARREKKCTFKKDCELRQKAKAKTCVDKAMTKIVYCQCEVHDPVTGKCSKKKMESVCVKFDSAKKCIKHEERCKPICKQEKCTKETVGADGKKHCLEGVCIKEDSIESMECTKYVEEPKYKCMQAGYSHICKWECTETTCHPSGTKEHTHALGYDHNAKADGNKVKVYNAEGHLMTEVELTLLAHQNPKAFKNIVAAMDTAEHAAKSPKQIAAIKSEQKFLASINAPKKL